MRAYKNTVTILIPIFQMAAMKKRQDYLACKLQFSSGHTTRGRQFATHEDMARNDGHH